MATEVTDPSDWLDTPLAPLSNLDGALRCQVCKEYLESPMITTCAHTFCSLCIRRCLSADGRCPFCRAADQSNKLRKNTAIEEAVTAFRAARTQLLAFGKEAAAAEAAGITRKRRGAHKRTGEQAGLDANGVASPRKTRASARRSSARPSASPIVVSDSEEAQSTASETEDTAPADGLVACPICQRRMPEERVFNHLETHGSPSRSVPDKQVFGVGQGTFFPSREQKQEPLPGLNYSLLTETALRKKVAALGIPSGGSKVMLQRRHGEWVNIWNANCDSTKPRAKRDLIRDLEVWERSQNKPQAPPTAGAVMDKDFDGQAWATAHGADFSSLIAKARAKRSKESKLKDAPESKASGEQLPDSSVPTSSLANTSLGPSGDPQDHEHHDVQY